jgi:hypothetical protein
MAKQIIPQKGSPILVMDVDQLLQFSEKAVTDRAVLASLEHACPRSPIHTDIVDEVIEFRDRATDDPSTLNGSPGTTRLPTRNPGD